MDRILVTNSAVSIALPPQTPKKLQIDLTASAHLTYNIKLERVQNPLKYWPNYREQCGDIIGNGRSLLLNP